MTHVLHLSESMKLFSSLHWLNHIIICSIVAITLLDIVLIHRSGVVQGMVFVVVLCGILYWIGGVYRSMQTLHGGLSHLNTTEALAFKKLRGFFIVIYVVSLCIGVAALRGIVDRVRFDNGGYPIFG